MKNNFTANRSLFQLDVPNVLLNGHFQEEVYMSPTPVV